MGIMGSWIETKWIFNMVGVIISLRWYYFGIEKLDNIVLIMKIWLKDPRSSCTIGERLKTIEDYLNVEDNLLEENEKWL